MLKTLIKTKLRFLLPAVILPEFGADYLRYLRHSGVIGTGSREKHLGKIVAAYHVIEKGLTMPETRLGFGEGLVRSLAKECQIFRKHHGTSDGQWLHAVAVLQEYLSFHEEKDFKLSSEMKASIKELSKGLNVTPSQQIDVSGPDYFSNPGMDFKTFAASRKSVRNYAKDEVPLEVIREAVSIAI